MATPDRDTTNIYNNDGTKRTVYTRDSGSSTGWFVGIIVALALLAIAYLVFSANSQPSTSTTTVNNTPAVTAPAAPADTTTAPAANDNGAATTPMTTAPATSTPATAPSTGGTSAVTSAPEASAPATTTSSAPVAASSAAQ